VRVTVKNATEDRYAHNVHAKVIGSANDKFTSGQTDLRGIFVADAIRGTATVIAKTDKDRYAFYRGKTVLGQPTPAQPAPQSEQSKAKKKPTSRKSGKDVLLKNVGDQNTIFNAEQRENYRQLLQNKSQGVKARAAQ
jgi:hypothetical protein